MKTTYKILLTLTVLCALFTIAPTSKAEGDQPVKVTFSVQHKDIAIQAMWPKVITSGTNEVIEGSFVTVLLSDRYEFISAQCHWDGVSEKNRYAFTIYYRLKGVSRGPNPLISTSINLAEFTAAYRGPGEGVPVEIVKMGVLPLTGDVSFREASMTEISKGNSPSAYLSKTK